MFAPSPSHHVQTRRVLTHRLWIGSVPLAALLVSCVSHAPCRCRNVVAPSAQAAEPKLPTRHGAPTLPHSEEAPASVPEIAQESSKNVPATTTHPPSEFPEPGEGVYRKRDGFGTFEVVDEDGQTLPLYEIGSQAFVVGEAGQTYQIRLGNPYLDNRVEAVVSVDGINVLSGEKANCLTQRGYIIGAKQKRLIRGFQRSAKEVSPFRFAKAKAARGRRVGGERHASVIAVAWFSEREYRTTKQKNAHKRMLALQKEHAGELVAYRPTGLRGDVVPDEMNEQERFPRPATSRKNMRFVASIPAKRGPLAYRWVFKGAEATARASANDLFTQAGKRVRSPVYPALFERYITTNIRAVTGLRYDSAKGLKARGVPFKSGRPLPPPSGTPIPGKVKRPAPRQEDKSKKGYTPSAFPGIPSYEPTPDAPPGCC